MEIRGLLSRVSAAAVFAVATLYVAALAPAGFPGHPQVAAAASSVCIAGGPGDVLLSGSSWLGGQGVDVCDNGGSAASDWGEHKTNGIFDGEMWQCVELVDRLYLTRGWIDNTWWGNGDTIADSQNVPSGLVEQNDGSITDLKPGDVVSLGDSTTGTAEDDGGHAAIVNSVSGSTVTLINQNAESVTSQATLSGGSLTMVGWPGYYIIGVVHAPTSGGGGGSPWPPPDGSYISYNGYIYVIAGGAPIYVSNWSSVGGPHSSTPATASQFDSLRPYPLDGTYVEAAGQFYVVAGGAPIYVSNWSSVGGPHTSVEIDPAAIGNADQAAPWDHLHDYPANGTFVAASGYIYEIAGGAPIYVSNWASIGGPHSSTEIDPSAIGNADQAAPWNHLHQYPENGTFLDEGGPIFEVAGGAPLFVTSTGYHELGSPAPVNIDPWDIANAGSAASHLNSVPANGTFLNTTNGNVYRVAGGAPLGISSWAPFGGVQPYVSIDEWDITNITNPAAHLNSTPVDGTILEDVPSDSYWQINSNCRSAVAPSGSAVAVTDGAVTQFSICGTGSGTAASSGAYDLVGSDGGVFVFGPQGQGFFGSLPGLGVHVSNIVGIVPTADDQGYFLVGSDGGVFAFGDAPFENSLPGLGVHVSNIVGIVPTADDQGYWLVSSTGGVYALGDAPFVGGLGGTSTTPITGIAATHDSGGYWLVGQNGSVFPFGDAQSFGSLPTLGVSVSNIVAIVPTSDGQGYWLIGSDGGIFAFGDATEVGSLPGLGVNVNNIVGAVPTA